MSVEEEINYHEDLFLVSFPHSGSNMVSYILQRLKSLKPVGDGAHAIAEDIEWQGQFIKTHLHKKLFIDIFNNQCKNIIVPIRNYKECLTRMFMNEGKKFSLKNFKSRMKNLSLDKIKQKNKNSQKPLDYLTVINTFHNFNGNKLFIYYEDLLLQPQVEVDRIARFLGIGEFLTNEIKSNIDDYLYKSLNQYRQKKPANRRNTNSKIDINVYNQKVNKNVKLNLDRYLYNKYPELTNNYLFRYNKTWQKKNNK